MSGNNYFQFKQFKITQEKAAMRVGTDGVLLGAWANITGATNILDIGTGTGLIALMLAQRCSAKITGVEIDKPAADEALQNVKYSPWDGRINIINSSFQDFVKNTNPQFDLIVSNPPFFMNDMRPKNLNRNIARHGDKLPLSHLADGVEKCLTQNGRFSLILPVFSAEKFIDLSTKYGLNLVRLTEVKPKNVSPTLRFLMEFKRVPAICRKDSINIRTSDGSDYTKTYKNFTRDFYLDL